MRWLFEEKFGLYDLIAVSMIGQLGSDHGMWWLLLGVPSGFFSAWMRDR